MSVDLKPEASTPAEDGEIPEPKSRIGSYGSSRPTASQRPSSAMARPTPKASASLPSRPPPTVSFAGAAARKRQLELAEQNVGGQYDEGQPQAWTAKQPAASGYPQAWVPQQPAGHAPKQTRGNYSAPKTEHSWQQQSFNRPTPKSAAHAYAGPGAKGARPSAALKPQPPSQPPPHLTQSAPSASWINVDASSQMVLEGYPAMAPVVLGTPEIQPLMSAANNLLYDLAGDATSEVILNDDTDWSAHPEVGHALRVIGQEEVSMCIAVCPGLGCWAVGLASQKKKREQAARLALCLALAGNADRLEEVCSQTEGFKELCESAGLITEDSPSKKTWSRPAQAKAAATPAWQSNGWGEKKPWSQNDAWSSNDAWDSNSTWASNGSSNKKKKKTAASWQEEDPAALEAADLAAAEAQEREFLAEMARAEAEALAAAEAEAAALTSDFEPQEPGMLDGAAEQTFEDFSESPPAPPSKRKWTLPTKAPLAKAASLPKTAEKKSYWQEEEAMPRDVPLWIRLPADEPIPSQLEGLPAEALVLANDGTGRKGLYSHADAALSALLEDFASEIEFVDDPDWALFPAVGSALKAIAPKEECTHLAICASRCLWAVGVASKGKNRAAASKVAIAASILLQLTELSSEDLPDLSQLQSFADFVEESRAAQEQFMSSSQ